MSVLRLLLWRAAGASTITDPRIAIIEAYAAEHPSYDAGSIIPAAVDEVDIAAADGTVTAIQMPEAVQALDGYGGEGTVLNISDKTYTAADGTTTDISDILDERFEALAVESGGSITYHNASYLEVPNTVTYAVNLTEVASNE